MAMRKLEWMLIILVSLIAIQSISATSAASVDDWPTFRHDASHSGYTADSDSANSAKPVWNFTAMEAVLSSPAVSNDRVFVGSRDHALYCLNSSNGEMLWLYQTGNEVDSSPAVYDGNVYVGSDDGNLYCINIDTAKPSWATKVGGLVRSSPVVVDSRVYIGSGNHDFLCFNATYGTPIWTFPTPKRIVSSPAVSDGIVYFACDNFFVYALNASTGSEIWRRPTGSDINSPCIFNGCLYIGSYEGYVFSLNASTGDELWKYQTQDTVASSAAVAYECVFVGSEDGSVYCLNAANGHKIWQTPTGYWVWSSPAVADGNVYVGSEDYSIYCLNASTGTKQWNYPTANMVDSSPAVVNGTLYIGSSDHHVYAFTMYNSTVQPISNKPSKTATGTILFDFLIFVVAAVAIFTIVRFVRTKRRSWQNTQVLITSNENQSWFSLHTDALCVLVVLVFLITFFLSLTNAPMWVADEKTYSQMAYHMVKSGDYLVPYGFGEPAIWAGKPPLYMWTMSLAYQAFGVNNFASRLSSPVFGGLSLLVVYFLAKKLYNRYVGLLSVVVLGTFAMFFSFATHAMTDGPLVFFMLASVYFLLLSEETKNAQWYAALSGMLFGLALLTKQLEALLIPMIIIVYFALTKKSFRFLFTKRLGLFLGLALLVFMPWVLYMDLSFKSFWDYYFIYADFTRTLATVEGHVGNYFFYFNYLVKNDNMLWLALLPFATGLCAVNAVVKGHKGDILILAWIAIVLAVFTVAQTKLYWYILPAIPAFAIAISAFLCQAGKKIQFSMANLLLNRKKLRRQSSMSR
jgi:outer membrane protein assembly factor BamB